MGPIAKRIRKTKASLRKLPLKVEGLRYLLVDSVGRDERPVIGFHIIGGMGDHLMAARFIRDFVDQAGEVSFDVYSLRPAMAQWVFDKIPKLRHVRDARSDLRWTRRRYDLFATLMGYVKVDHVASPDRRDHWEPELRQACEAITRQSGSLRKFTRSQPSLDGYFGQYVSLLGANRQTFAHHMADLHYPGDQLDLPVDTVVLSRHSLSSGRYITVSNGYDETTPLKPGQRVTKVYDGHGEIVARLKRLHPELQVVQIGSATSTPLPQADLNLVGRTTLPEVATLLQHARFHLDNEGGLVHLARCMGTRCCVVFGPTSPSYFGYEANLNIVPTICGNCWWMDDAWMTKCLHGDATPRCMQTHDPAHIAGLIANTFWREPQSTVLSWIQALPSSDTPLAAVH